MFSLGRIRNRSEYTPLRGPEHQTGWRAKAKRVATLVQSKTPSVNLAQIRAEPKSSLRAAIRRPLGWKPHFNFYGMNPRELTQTQASQSAFLLIHGKNGNESAWTSLGKTLQERSHGPVFTIHLPKGADYNSDVERVKRKWEEIAFLYSRHNKRDFKIHLVGHSRGAFVATKVAFTKCNWQEQQKGRLGKIIKLGDAVEPSEYNAAWESGLLHNLFEITGQKDIFTSGKSRNIVSSEFQFKPDCGHARLLTMPEVHSRIIAWTR